MADRLETLKALVAQNPSHSFSRYGLAMEYTRMGLLEDAYREYAALISGDPGYSAAYFHGGQVLEKLHRLEEAKEIYRKGIEVTTKQGDSHARSELQAALDLLQ